jgi:hypothetical protein
MILYNNKDFRLCVADIETLFCIIDLGFYDPDEAKWYEFEISEDRNDLSAFAKFYARGNWDYIVYYNGVAFDAQVIQYILNTWERWYDLSNMEIVGRIYEFVQDLIDDQKYNLALPYKESQFEIPVIDVFTVLGLNAEQRYTSLKKCEFQLDMPSVEEMPIHHSTKHLDRAGKEEVKSYRRTDIRATHVLLNLVLGNTEHEIYKNNNQLELRASIEEEFGLPCRNYSDIKIGDELIKKYYAEATGVEIKALPRKGFFRKEIRLKHCIPSYVKFKTKALQDLLKQTKETIIYPFVKKELFKGKKQKEFELNLTFHGRKYTLARGGLHADQSNEIWESKNGYFIEDHDVASYYPRIIINNQYFPFHLGKEMLRVYEQLYNKRVALKPLAKKDKKVKGVVEAIKLSLNSVFGKMGNTDSWLYDAQTMYSITLTGEFTLLMLIEMFEEAGIRVISCNTDGVTTYFREDQRELQNSILKEWQEMTNFEIETVPFNKFWYSTVNDYIAEKCFFDDEVKRYMYGKPGDIKKKGDFITDFELFKNKSYRILPLSWEAHFKYATDPIEFIREHKNVYDFCIMAKATGNTWMEEQWEEDGRIVTKEHKKLVRYYLSNSGRELYKRGIGTTGKRMNVRSNAPNELGDIHVHYFNQATEDIPDIDYNQYIFRSLKMLDKLFSTKKAKKYADMYKPTQQLGLFNF